jgi:hypothetical protein
MVEIVSLDGKLEPEAKNETGRHDAALISIAVSLKRIADTMDGTASGVCVNDTIFGRRRAD